MISTKDILQWLKTLDTKAENYYTGKIDNRKEETVGVYPARDPETFAMAVGGVNLKLTKTKSVTLLIHHNKNLKDSEIFAFSLYDNIINAENVEINGHKVGYIQPARDYPVFISTDENGVYEFVIDLTFYYE